MKKIILAWPKFNRHNKYLDILYEELEKNGYKVISHKNNRISFLWKKVDFFHFHWLSSFVDRNFIGAVIFSILFIFYIKILKIKKTKIVWTLHNSVSFTHSSRNILITKFLVNFLYKNVDKIIIHSKFQKNHIPTIYDSKIVYIPHHNYLPILHNNIETKTGDYYLFFGSIAPYKGVELLIEIFNMSKEKLIIAGKVNDKKYKQKLESLIKNKNILFEDKFLDDLEMEKLVKNAKAIVLPFKRITNSGSLIYALSCRKKVFVNDSILTDELKREFGLKKCILSLSKIFDKSISKECEFEQFLEKTDINYIVKNFYVRVFEC